MLPLTINIIIKNDEATIRRAIESVVPLDCHFFIANAGSRDGTASICKEYTPNVLRMNQGDRGKLRNEMMELSKTNWQFYLEPWEALMCGHDNIREIVDGDALFHYNCGVMQEDLLTRQIRLWRKDSKARFINPVHETIKGPAAYSDAVIYVLPHSEDEESLEEWLKANPLAAEPIYYKACRLLSQGRHKEFLANAGEYLFREKGNTMSSIMTRYYCAIVQCYITKDMGEALKNIMTCIAEKPLMAEFWCLLGDIYFHSKEFDKARAFYENAPILGCRRLQDDPWPMHLPKYKEYPEEMISRCNDIIAQAKVISV